MYLFIRILSLSRAVNKLQPAGSRAVERTHVAGTEIIVRGTAVQAEVGNLYVLYVRYKLCTRKRRRDDGVGLRIIPIWTTTSRLRRVEKIDFIRPLADLVRYDADYRR